MEIPTKFKEALTDINEKRCLKLKMKSKNSISKSMKSIPE